jgi:hypothetical protein
MPRHKKRQPKKKEPKQEESKKEEKKYTPLIAPSLPLRLVELAMLALGVAGLIQAIYFIPAVICVYIFIIIITFDLYNTIQNKWLRKMIILLSVIFLFLFSFKFVLVKGPLNISGSGNIYGYPEGTNIGGIKWNKDCSAVRLYIDNETDRDYTGMHIYINIPNISIWAIGQITNIPNVSFIPEPGPIIVGQGFAIGVDPKTGEKHEIPLVPEPSLSCTSKYQILCPMFPRHSHMDLILEVSLRKGGGSFFGEKAIPKEIKINTSYHDYWRDRTSEIKLYLLENSYLQKSD